MSSGRHRPAAEDMTEVTRSLAAEASCPCGRRNGLEIFNRKRLYPEYNANRDLCSLIVDNMAIL